MVMNMKGYTLLFTENTTSDMYLYYPSVYWLSLEGPLGVFKTKNWVVTFFLRQIFYLVVCYLKDHTFFLSLKEHIPPSIFG